MDLQLTKLELIEMILKTKNFSVLEQVKVLLNQTSNNAKTSEPKDWWDELNEEEKNEIKKGLSDLEQRKTVSHKEVMKIFEKWH